MSTGAETQSSRAASSPPGPSGGAVLSFDRALALMDGDATLLREMFALFFDTAPENIMKIQAALAGGDRRTLEREAHSLKGSASSVGATALANVAAALEECGRSGRLEQEALDLAGELPLDLAALSEAVAAAPWPDAP